MIEIIIKKTQNIYKILSQFPWGKLYQSDETPLSSSFWGFSPFQG